MAKCMAQCGSIVAISTIGLVTLSGCGARGSGLPATVTLTLPDGSEVTARQGDGALSLADSTWEFSNEQGVAFVTIRFGPNGELDRFEDNTIAVDILGPTILFDGLRHNTGLPAVQYAAATFGAETTDATGFSFEGRLGVFAPLFGQVGSGMAKATGERAPDDPDMMTGNFSFAFTVSPNLPIPIPVPEEDLTGEFTFIARRVE